MKPLGTYITLALRGSVFIVLCGLLGALLGVGAALARPSTETSTAVTTLTSQDVPMAVEAVYSVNQMIRVTMPGYVASATDATVIQAAAAASGLDPRAVSSGLSVVRQPDASVIEWRLTAPAGGNAQAALAAALTQFDKVVAQSAPKAEKGQTLVKVVHNQPASAASVRATSPLLAGIAGALVGLIAGVAVVIFRGSQANIVTSRDSIELDLDTPVVAEIGTDEASRVQGWRYAAASLGRNTEPHRVLLLGGRARPADSDVRLLSEAIVGITPVLDPAITVRSLREGEDIAAQASSADGVVIVLVKGGDSSTEFASQVQGLRHVCRGPVVAVLDASPSSRAAITRSGANRRVRRQAQSSE